MEYKTNKRCPNCRSKTFAAYMTVKVEYLHFVTDGVAQDDGLLSSEPQEAGGCGHCSNCGHQWRFKGDHISAEE